MRLSGPLKKRGPRRNWDDRWFELNDKTLQYFNNTTGPQVWCWTTNTIFIFHILTFTDRQNVLFFFFFLRSFSPHRA